MDWIASKERAPRLQEVRRSYQQVEGSRDILRAVMLVAWLHVFIIAQAGIGLIKIINLKF